MEMKLIDGYEKYLRIKQKVSSLEMRIGAQLDIKEEKLGCNNTV